MLRFVSNEDRRRRRRSTRVCTRALEKKETAGFRGLLAVVLVVAGCTLNFGAAVVSYSRDHYQLEVFASSSGIMNQASYWEEPQLRQYCGQPEYITIGGGSVLESLVPSSPVQGVK